MSENYLFNLVSLPLERNVLSCLVKFPNIFPDIDNFVTEEAFNNKTHHTIFCVIRAAYLKNEKLDKVLLAQKIKNLGINKFDNDGIEIFDYVENLYGNQINEKSSLEYCKELVKLRVLRGYFTQSQKIQEYLCKEGKSQEIREIVSNVDRLNGEKSNEIFSVINKEGPVDLVSGITEYIEELGNQPAENAIMPPYKDYCELYAGYNPGDLVFYVARAKSSKSSFLLDICTKSVLTQNVKAIIVDTELDTSLLRRRLISSISGVNEYFIRTGFWRKNEEMVFKVRNALKEADKILKKIHHIYIGSADIDDILSLAKRWYYKEVGRIDKTMALICYDYVKLSDELSNQKYSKFKDYQLISSKVDKLKRLAMELPRTAVITAGQTNRSNSGDSRESHGGVVALSDSINTLSSSVFIINKVNLEEIAYLKTRYKIDCTHIMIPLYTRNLGALGSQHEKVRIKDKDGVKYEDNKIFFKVDSFNVKEIGALHKLEAKLQDHVDIQDGAGDSTGGLLD